MGIKYLIRLCPKKGAKNMEKFTFLEPNSNELQEGMICDPITGMCSPFAPQEESDKEKEEADE